MGYWDTWDVFGAKIEGIHGMLLERKPMGYWDTRDIRSNFNSRGVNSRELFGFFGHNSLPYHAIWTKIGGNLPTDLPDLPKPSKPTNNLKTHKILEK